MPRNARKPRNTQVTVTAPERLAPRDANGRYLKGFSGTQGLDVARARKQLNQLTIDGMTEAFRRGGKAAIDKVMKNAPAQFLKLCVLLVPRDIEITQRQGAKGMTDEQIAAAVEAIEGYLARRGRGLPPPTVIDAEPVGADASPALPEDEPEPTPPAGSGT